MKFHSQPNFCLSKISNARTALPSYAMAASPSPARRGWKFPKLPNFKLGKISTLLNVNPHDEHQREREQYPAAPGPVNEVFGAMNPPNPNDNNNRGSVQWYAEGSPVNGSWEPVKTYRGYQLAVRAKKEGDTTFYELQIGGSNQVTEGTRFTSREAAVGKGTQIVDSWESSTPPNAPAGDGTKTDGTVKVSNSGTSAGVKKSWVTRRVEGRLSPYPIKGEKIQTDADGDHALTAHLQGPDEPATIHFSYEPGEPANGVYEHVTLGPLCDTADRRILTTPEQDRELKTHVWEQIHRERNEG